jgi:hypothetical protein
MGKPETYKVGEAPWETGKGQIFKVGEAPWETGAQSQQSPGLLQSALNGISAVGSAIDSVTGAPVRSAISAAQNGENPLPAYAHQFGADPSAAPTGFDIVKKAGLSTDHARVMTAEQMKAWNDQNARMSPPGAPQVRLPDKELYAASPAEAGGLAMDVAADPTMLIPGVAESRLGKSALAKLGEVAGKVSEPVAAGLKAAAEKAAVKATGATATQAEKFADDAGRKLLDQGVVRFGDSQAKIAERATGAMKAAEDKIDTALKALDAQGVVVDTKKVRQALVDKVRDLAGAASEQDVLKAINGEISNIKDAAEARGSTVQKISEAEQEKRDFSRKARNWQNPDVGQAGKEAYLAYKDEVENAAKAADPKAAEIFKEGKEAYGLFSPIEEAAQRRALTGQQSASVGLKDLAAAAVGGPKAVIANRFISPRLASATAVTLDKTASLLRGVPELASLETKNPTAFKAVLDIVNQHHGALPMVADTPTKGPDKWANDGLEKLIEHGGAGDKAQLEKLKGAKIDQSTKELLIRASDLKPGTKAMDKILEKLKAQKIAGDE